MEQIWNELRTWRITWQMWFTLWFTLGFMITATLHQHGILWKVVSEILFVLFSFCFLMAIGMTELVIRAGSSSGVVW